MKVIFLGKLYLPQLKDELVLPFLHPANNWPLHGPCVSLQTAAEMFSNKEWSKQRYLKDD